MGTKIKPGKGFITKTFSDVIMTSSRLKETIGEGHLNSWRHQIFAFSRYFHPRWAIRGKINMKRGSICRKQCGMTSW